MQGKRGTVVRFDGAHPIDDIAAHGGGSVAAAAVHGYTVGFSISAGLLGAAAVLALLLLRAQRSDVSADPALAMA